MHYSKNLSKKLAFSTAVIAAIIGIVIVRSGNKKKPAVTARILAEKAYRQAQSEQPNFAPTPEIVLKEVDFYLFGNNKIKNCHVQTQESRVFPETQITECVKICCNLKTNQNQVATLKAPKAIVNHQKKTIIFPGKVCGHFNEWLLENHDAFYDAQQHIIKANTITLNLTTKKFSINACKGKFDLKNEVLYLEGNVICIFEKEKHEKDRIPLHKQKP